ncbi:MMPL family transporter [Streptomyces ipomoeae]|uniref:MMPL family transporter n=1 Tax=Streptomyces ipomoeae TaxID=103232 RepID=UPI0015EFF9A7|nr:MMPL family transporter [Streptomyces ipomoeae]MDX2939110.1 MMPL family transporter [Streptomyces ipomoeae]
MTFRVASADGEKAGLALSQGGDTVKAEAASRPAELIGLAVAAVALVITFGSLLAARLPLFAAILGVLTTILAITIATAFWNDASQPTALALMLGSRSSSTTPCSVSPATATRSATATTEEATGRAFGTVISAVS